MKHHVVILVLTMGILVKCASDTRVKRESVIIDQPASTNTQAAINSEETKGKSPLHISETSPRHYHPDSRENVDEDYIAEKSDIPSRSYPAEDKESSRPDDYDDNNYRKDDEPRDYNSDSHDSTLPRDSDYEDSRGQGRYDNSHSNSKNLKESYHPNSSYSRHLDEPQHKSTSKTESSRLNPNINDSEEDTSSHSHRDNSEESDDSHRPSGSRSVANSHYPSDSAESDSSYRHVDETSSTASHRPTFNQEKDFYPEDAKKMEAIHRSNGKTESSSRYYKDDEKMASPPESSESSSESNDSGRPSPSYEQNDYKSSNKPHYPTESGKSIKPYSSDYPQKSSSSHNLGKADTSYHSGRKPSSDYDNSNENSNEKFDYTSPKIAESTDSHLDKSKVSSDKDEDYVPLTQTDHRNYRHNNEDYNYYDNSSPKDSRKSHSYHDSWVPSFGHGPMSSENSDQIIPPSEDAHEAATAASVKINEKSYKSKESLKLESKTKRHYDDYYHPHKTTTPPPAIPGVAGVDYPILAAPPATGFNCSRQKLAGYYADPAAQCQVFYICQADGRQDAFLCPNGTIFNQKYLVCDWWYNVNCGQSASYYKVNSKLYVAAASKVKKSTDKKDDDKNNDGLKDKASSGAITRIQAVGYDKNDKSENSFAYQEVTEGIGSENKYIYDY